MRNLLTVYLVLIANFNFTFSQKVSKQFDDVKCEVQLKYFSASLSKRESWALDCKSGNLSSITRFSIFLFSPIPRSV